MDYLGYGTPETAAKEFMDPEVVASEVAYPSEETLSKGTSFLFLPSFRKPADGGAVAPGQDGLSHIKIPCITDLPRRKEWGCLKRVWAAPMS